MATPDVELAMAAGALLLLSNVPYGGVVLAPLRWLTTWAHEVCHGLAALAVGGGTTRLDVFLDGTGLARTRVPVSRLPRAVVAGAGYPGASLLGAGLLALRKVPDGGTAGLFVLGLSVGLTVALWVRNGAGVAALLGVAAALTAGGMFLRPQQADLVLTFVGAAIALNALTSVRALYGAQQVAGGKPVASDASVMAELLWLPSWVWATLWICVGLASLVLAV
jgi:hypothetical protein